MDIYLTALTIILTVPAVSLTVVIIGIHQQERTGISAIPPPGACAAVARKVLALHANPSFQPTQTHPTPEQQRHRPSATHRPHTTTQRQSVPSGVRP